MTMFIITLHLLFRMSNVMLCCNQIKINEQKLLICQSITDVDTYQNKYFQYLNSFKVEHHANAEYENSLKSSEKIACVGQRLMYQ